MLKAKNEEEIKNMPIQDYEDYIIKEAFKKIVPTFCQDIIASILNSNLPQEYNKYQEIILDIYKQIGRAHV